MSAKVAWISVSPVKGMRMQELEAVELAADGAAGDRRFFFVDSDGALISVTRLGPLLEIVPEHDPRAGRLRLTLDGEELAAGPVETGEPEPVTFFGEPVRARPVLGPFSEAVSGHCGARLRLMARPEGRAGVDRGAEGGATLLGLGSLERLAAEAARAGEPGPIDRRRFRMTFGIDGLDAHQEDQWIGREVAIGEAAVEVRGHVGRCAATTRDPERGEADFRTLHHLRAYRGGVDSEEPLPFGVYARVGRPGTVRLGDPVELRDPRSWATPRPRATPES